MLYYHSTIYGKLEEILKKGKLEPGQESPDDPSYIFEWMILGQYHKPSKDYLYFWKTFDKAMETAEFISHSANRKYTPEQRRPVVITTEFTFEMQTEPDPDSSGLRYKGSVSSEKFAGIWMG